MFSSVSVALFSHDSTMLRKVPWFRFVLDTSLLQRTSMNEDWTQFNLYRKKRKDAPSDDNTNRKEVPCSPRITAVRRENTFLLGSGHITRTRIYKGKLTIPRVPHFVLISVFCIFGYSLEPKGHSDLVGAQYIISHARHNVKPSKLENATHSSPPVYRW